MPRPTRLLLLGTLAALLGAADVTEVTVALDPAVVARNQGYGYTPADLQRWFNRPHTLTYDTTGVDRARIGTLPAAGVHPRILFSAEDLPAIRQRLQGTPGKLIDAAIRKVLADTLTGPTAKFGAAYRALAAGDRSVKAHGDQATLGYAVLYEAFRCLLDDDRAGGATVAAAITTLAAIDQQVLRETREKIRAKNPEAVDDFERVGKEATHEGTLGLAYDLAHGWMTPAQRDAVRAVIIEVIDGKRFVGVDTLRTQSTCSSNHIPWVARMIHLAAAVEGEPGAPADAYRRCADAMRWFYGVGIYRDGDAFEGWGKNFLFAEHAWIMARHGDDAFALVNVRNAFRNYFIEALHPWGGAWTFYDSNGGTGNKLYRNGDVLVYKALFPRDPAIDVVYRNHIDPDYKEFAAPVNVRHYFLATEALVMALFPESYDAAVPREQALKNLTADRPLASWSEDTGNLIARSAWSPDALYLHYLNRSNIGGHLYSDRGHFSVYSQGRTWGIYRPMRQERQAYEPRNRTGILIDGEGVSVVPGKCVAQAATADAALVATDLKPAWDYVSNYIFPNKERKNAIRLPFTANEFRLRRSPFPWMDLPLDEMPHWETSRAPEPIPANPSPFTLWRQRPVPTAFAFRTAGLVRGPHPYVMVLDDLRRDHTDHRYAWGMTLADDVTLAEATVLPDGQGAEARLGERSPAGGKARGLTVRLLGVPGLAAPVIAPETSANPPMKDVVIPKLVFTATTPEFRSTALLYDQRPGEAGPTTAWNGDRSVLTITWPDQVDELRFRTGTDQRRRVSIVRAGRTLIGGE